MQKSNNELVHEIVHEFEQSCDNLNRAIDFALTSFAEKLDEMHIDSNDVQEIKNILSTQTSALLKIVKLGDYSNVPDREELIALTTEAKGLATSFKDMTRLCRIGMKALVHFVKTQF